MDELKKKIDLQPIGEEQISTDQIAHSELWLVKDIKQTVFGPFTTKSLRKYSHKYQYLFEEARIYNLQNKSWEEFFSLPKFQRRKPQLVSAQNLIPAEEFIIKKDNQIIGPYSQEQVQKMLDNGKILSRFEASLDAGNSWIKLYEHHAFDRRSKKSNQDLPFIPKEVPAGLKAAGSKIKETQDALVGLAYIGKDKKTKKVKLKSTPPTMNEKKPAPKPHFQWWKFSLVGAFAFVAVLIGGQSFYNKEQTHSPSAHVDTHIRGIDNSQREPINKRVPASYEPKRIKSYEPSKAVNKVIPKIQKSVSKPKKYVQTHEEDNYYNNESENLDINDPEIREELSRELAGEMDEGEYAQPEPYNDNRPIQDEGGYQDEYREDSQQFDQPIMPEQGMEEFNQPEPEEYFDEESRIEHSQEEY